MQNLDHRDKYLIAAVSIAGALTFWSWAAYNSTFQEANDGSGDRRVETRSKRMQRTFGMTAQQLAARLSSEVGRWTIWDTYAEGGATHHIFADNYQFILRQGKVFAIRHTISHEEAYCPDGWVDCQGHRQLNVTRPNTNPLSIAGALEMASVRWAGISGAKFE